MSDVVFLAWGDKFFRDSLKRLIEYHQSKGDRVSYISYRDRDILEKASGADVAYIWNGSYPGPPAEAVKMLRDQKCKMVFMEVGWFPQGQYLYFDSEGTCGACSLFKDPLEWLKASDFERLDRMRTEYREGREMEDRGYVLVPLQVPDDQQIRKWSPYRWMGAFVTDTRERFKGKKVIFRRHPKDSRSYDDLDLGDEGRGNLKDLIAGASLVYGINSTVLLEASLMGKPVVSIGKSFLSIGQSREHALAALLARQVPVTTTNFKPWADEGRGLEHLRS